MVIKSSSQRDVMVSSRSMVRSSVDDDQCDQDDVVDRRDDEQPGDQDDADSDTEAPLDDLRVADLASSIEDEAVRCLAILGVAHTDRHGRIRRGVHHEIAHVH